MKSSKLLGVVIVLQGLILVGQWAGQPSAGTARADVTLPNPGERQLAIVEELKNVNSKLDKIYSALSGGDMTVKAVVVKDENKK
jgi:hypothetical protein